MKNLELLQLTHKPVGGIFTEKTAFFAQTSDSVYFIHNNSLHQYDLQRQTSIEVCPQSFEDIICIKQLTFEGKLCIATADFLYILSPNSINEIQSVAFPEKVASVSWNPTEELVVTASESGEVATYTIDYENAEFYPQGHSTVETKIPDTVYVGWGSKDTQFRGSEGKLKANQTQWMVNPVIDRKSVISWRGNGEMFVVNYWKDDKRMFIVFETPCRAMYRSEDCPGLQPTIAWRPTGNMIATLTEVSDKQSVAIFEKNGQKRFDFDLNFDGVKVKELRWSPCAQILTIYSETPSTLSENIHLLTCSNYRWYEKQTLTFTTDNPLLHFDWLETTQFTFTLRVVTKNEIVDYIFRQMICKSKAICAVVNGKILQLTNFGAAIIPPTLYSKKLVNDEPINFVVFDDNRVAIIDAGNNFKIFDVDRLETALSAVNLGEIIGDLARFPLAYHHFLVKGGNVYFIAETDSESVFYTLSLQNKELNFVNATNDVLRYFLQIPTDFEVVNMKQIDKMLFMNADLPQNSIKQVVVIVNDKPYNYQLTSSCHFYIDDCKISDTVNSFVVFDDYLLYTTKLNELHCIRLVDGFVEALMENKSKNYRRSVEQGATIVTAIPNSPRVVLQLPRGNLETISCRLISIDMLDRLLNDGKWEEALRFIRFEKLNANLLFDLNPNRFLGQIDRFISGVKTINELNSVCLEMEEDNVLKTIYKNWGKCDDFSGKISSIFGAILEYLDEVDYAPYITTIVIINLHFFTLRDALIYVQDLLRRSFDDFGLQKSVNEAINTLKTYGCDQEKLYTEALLLYDLDLARFVASCCQLDPRVYEPHINNLKNLSEVQKRFEILLYGKRPKIAIAYLLRCPNVESDQILNFVKTHNVSREAYESCKKESRHYKVVSKAFAEDLSKKGHHQEAGVVLKRAGLLKEALQEYKLDFKWREVLDLLKELEVEEAEKSRIIDEMAGRLVQRHMIKDAALLYEFYANNYEMAVKILIENYFFEEAIHLAKKYNRQDIIVSDIIPKLNKHKTYLEEKLSDLDETFDKYRTRLGQVRRSKLTKFTNFSYEGDDRDNDIFSDAGSVTSKSSRSSKSRSSTASSRNRRKEEKKKQDLREGGVYEDIALIRALHCLIKEFYSKGQEVRSCCLLLLQESDVSFGVIRNLHDLFSKVDQKIKNGLVEIWPPHFYSNNQNQDVQQLVDLENFEHLDIEYRRPPSYDSTWSLNLFKNL